MNKSNMKKEYSLAYYGRIYNPPNWFYNPASVINRIYYIVSGTAYYMDNIPLKPGYLYIFNASPEFRVSQSEDDPVDHVYFDFFTYRELISSCLLYTSAYPFVRETFLHMKTKTPCTVSVLPHILYQMQEKTFLNLKVR